MRAKLKLLRGSSAGKLIELRRSKFTIGRADECQLRPNHEAISRRHCEFSLHNDKVTIQDLGSRNGTFLNGEALKVETELATGDELRMGPLKFEVIVTDDAGNVQLPPGPDPKDHAIGDDAGDSGLISQWLEEADESASSKRTLSPETRQFKLDETADLGDSDDATRIAATDETKAISKKGKKKARKEPGKLPIKRPEMDSADSQSAAAETLKRLFNRGAE